VRRVRAAAAAASVAARAADFATFSSKRVGSWVEPRRRRMLIAVTVVGR
jgi:hypothetical protein